MTKVEEAAERLRQRAQQEVDRGALPSCQYAVAQDDVVLLSETLGEASPGNRFHIFSVTKAIVASVVWQLIAEGALDPALPVATWWPGFAAHGKERVTLEHVMLHTSGFPLATVDATGLEDRDSRVRQMESWTLTFEPGTKFEYHPLSAHWVLAELIARTTGDDHRVAVRERVLDPLGLDRLELGVPVERQGDILDIEARGELPPNDEVKAALGIDVPPGFTSGVLGPDDILWGIVSPEGRAAGSPGGGAVSDAASVALFLQALLDDRKGLWDPEILRDATTNIRNHLPTEFGWPVMRSLGLEIAGGGVGAKARLGWDVTSPRAFGHGGAGGQIAWADPDNGVSFCFLTNGFDRNFLRESRRCRALSGLAASVVAA